MSVMIQAPAAANAEIAETPSADIPAQHDAEPTEEVTEEVLAEVTADVSDGTTASEDSESEERTSPEPAAEPVAEPVAEVTEDKTADDKGRAKPKRKSAPRKAAGTKTLVVLREGRVQFADPDTVLVIDLDEAASPDTDVHDVVDRLTELRDALDCPGKADAVKALTDLIQEKALG
jgi:hypothetical protein